MKKIVLAILIIVGAANTSTAQTKEEVAAQRTTSFEQMSIAAKEVGLDEKQSKKLKEVFEELFKRQDEIKADATLTPEQKKENLKAANEKKDWKLRDILGGKVKGFSEVRKRLVAEAAAKKG